jgi:hypothetical protein
MSIARRTLVVLFGSTLALAFWASAIAGSPAQTSSSPAVTLIAPTDWLRSDDGNVVTALEADLTADVPSGPRARIVTVKHPKKAKARTIVKGITAAAAEFDSELIDAPTTATFGAADVPGTVITFSVTVRGTRLVQRYVLVTPTGGEATLVVLEAPEAQWEVAEGTLLSAIDVT